MPTRLRKPKPADPSPKSVSGKTAAAVNFDDLAERAAFVRDLQKKAGKRVHAAVKKLQDVGIIDAAGNRINKKLPSAMLKCQPPE